MPSTVIARPGPSPRAVAFADDVPVLRLRGDLNPGAVVWLHQRLGETLDASHPRLVLDLRDARLLGTPTLSLLCGASRSAQRHGATLAIVGLSAADARTLEHLALEGLELHATVLEAVAGAEAFPQ